jgi:hypothetical protein
MFGTSEIRGQQSNKELKCEPDANTVEYNQLIFLEYILCPN